MTQAEQLKKIWYERNPVHEYNLDTGEDMFWETVLCVFNDLYSTQLAAKEKELQELRERKAPDNLEGYLEGKVVRGYDANPMGKWVHFNDALAALQQLADDKDAEIERLKSDLHKCQITKTLRAVSYHNSRAREAELQAENERLKEAAKHLLHLNNCEMEGLDKPTPATWYNAFNQLSELVEPPKQ